MPLRIHSFPAKTAPAWFLQRAQMAAFCYGDGGVWRTCESMVLSSRGQPSLRFTSRCRGPDPQTENGRLSHHLLLVHRWWNETICFPKKSPLLLVRPKDTRSDGAPLRHGERSESRVAGQARHWRLAAGRGCVAVRLRVVCGQCWRARLKDGEGLNIQDGKVLRRFVLQNNTD